MNLEAPVTTSAIPQPLSPGRRVVTLLSAARPEILLAQIGLVVIAAHVIDDNFVQPQPGTSAGDHLVSGLVPTIALLLFATFYGHMRTGLRATLAVVVGLFGVTIGISEAVYYAVTTGASGDDYSGFLAIPAGLLLAGVGVTALWRSRRRDDRLLRRYGRRLAIAVGSLVIAYVVVFPFFLSYVFTHLARTGVPVARLGAKYQNVAFQTKDGLTLKGWYVPSRNGAAVIVAPGRTGTQRHARMLFATATESSSSIGAARERATVIRTPSAGSQPRSRSRPGVPRGPPRRRSGADRRPRLVRRGRDAAPGCCRRQGFSGGRVGRSRRLLAA